MNKKIFFQAAVFCAGAAILLVQTIRGKIGWKRIFQNMANQNPSQNNFMDNINAIIEQEARQTCLRHYGRFI